MHVLFSGQVQGVGFRYTALSHAKEVQLTGTVRNLPDGTVELFALGTKECLEDLLARLQKSFAGSQIKSVDFQKPIHQFAEFIILR